MSVLLVGSAGPQRRLLRRLLGTLERSSTAFSASIPPRSHHSVATCRGNSRHCGSFMVHPVFGTTTASSTRRRPWYATPWGWGGQLPLGSHRFVSTSTAAQRAEGGPEGGPEGGQPSQTMAQLFEGRLPEFVPASVGGIPADSDDAYWWTHAAQCTRPAAREMVSRLEPGNPMGVDIRSKGISTASGSVYIFALGARHRHPRKIILFRQGDFYEALGFDAVMLVEHANLNPMSGHDNNATRAPKAGCPVVNLRPTLRNLMDAGYSVAVCEEKSEGYSVLKSRGRKTRYIAGIVTPAAPHYAKGLADSDVDAELCVPHSPPTTGIVATAVGYSLIQVDPELREIRVDTGLTDDVVISRISSGGFAPPLYIHDSVKTIVPGAVPRTATTAPGKGFVQSLHKTLSLGRGGLATFGAKTTHADTTQAFLQHICSDLGLPPPRLHDKATISASRDGNPSPPDMDAGAVADSWSSWQLVHGATHRDRLTPLHVSAASQLGLLPTTGIPRLVTAMLPRGGQHVPAPCTHWLEARLKVPPTYVDARKISAALHSLRTLELACPQTIPMSESRIAKLLREQETNHYFYREVREMLICTAAALDAHPLTGSPTTAPEAAQLALEVAASTGGTTGALPRVATVAAGARHVAERIGAVVLCDATPEVPAVSSERDWRHISMVRPEDHPDLRSSDCESIDKLFVKLEKWRGRVRPETLPDELKVLADKAKAVCTAVEAEFGPILLASDKSKVKLAQLVYEWKNDTIWLRGARVGAVAAEQGIEVLHPKDRWGITASGFWSTRRVEDAVAEYKYAVHDAQSKSILVLRDLANEITNPDSGHLHDVLLAASFSLVFRSLAEHARASLDAGWGLPTLTPAATLDDNGDETARLSYRGAWPYWISKSDAVPNNIDLDGMTILTGPNMAGKSTVNRVVGSIALLANCGFSAPCGSASISELDTICVRMTSTDSPADGKSGFAMEMVDIRSLLRDTTKHSLALIDELGRGTEYRAGTALSAAVLETLVATDCVGLFSTHLHAILDLDLATDSPIPCAAMGVAEVDGRLVATHLYEAGTSSRESLAFVVAQEHGIPAAVLARAQHLLGELPSIPLAYSTPSTSTTTASDALGTLPGALPTLEGGICHDMLPNLSEIQTFVLDTLDLQLPDCGIEAATPLLIDPSQAPPAICAQRSMLYVLRSPLGHLYVGETDGLHERLAAHRGKPMWKSADTVAIAMPDGRSQARKAEAILIKEMHERNWPISNRHDGMHLRFGAADVH